MFSLLMAYFISTGSQIKPIIEPLPATVLSQQSQYKGLLKELRCLVCQNQDLADSNASLAKDLRDQVWYLVQTGQSDKQIKAYLQARYGDFILFKPPFNLQTWSLWLGPFFLLLMGLIVLSRICFRRHTHE